MLQGGDMSNRVYQRVQVTGFQADVSDGLGFFPGEINDVSRFGICMKDLPKRVNEATKKMTVVVSGNGKNFKMVVRPKWSRASGICKTVGFEIVNTPYEWTEFIIQLEPKSNQDSWDTVYL